MSQHQLIIIKIWQFKQNKTGRLYIGYSEMVATNYVGEFIKYQWIKDHIRVVTMILVCVSVVPSFHCFWKRNQLFFSYKFLLGYIHYMGEIHSDNSD
jgi:hypothetical protein